MLLIRHHVRFGFIRKIENLKNPNRKNRILDLCYYYKQLSLDEWKRPPSKAGIHPGLYNDLYTVGSLYLKEYDLNEGLIFTPIQEESSKTKDLPSQEILKVEKLIYRKLNLKQYMKEEDERP